MTSSSEPKTAAFGTVSSEPGATSVSGGDSTPEEVLRAENTSISSIDIEDIAKVAKDVGKSFLHIFAKPAAAGKEFVADAELAVSLSLMAVQALLSSIFSLFVVRVINRVFGYISIIGDYRFSGVKAFFLTLLFSLIGSGVLLLLLWLMLMILKAKLRWKQLTALTAVRSVAVVPFTVLSMMLFLINPMLGMMVYYIISPLLACFFLLETVRGMEGINGNKALYGVYTVIVMFVLFGMIFISLAGRLYAPRDLWGSIDSLRGLISVFV